MQAKYQWRPPERSEAAVPISFLVDPQHQLVRTTYVGVITLVDLASYARDLADRDLLKHAQLLDARHATLELSYEDTRIFAELMASLRSKHGSAQVAFVAGNAPSYYVAETYRELGAGANPRYAVFDEVLAAEMWLELGGR
jgi:predicted nucleic acid-binding protein